MTTYCGARRTVGHGDIDICGREDWNGIHQCADCKLSDLKIRLDKAERSLIASGFQDLGGEAWKPPLGQAPAAAQEPDDKARLAWIHYNLTGPIRGTVVNVLADHAHYADFIASVDAARKREPIPAKFAPAAIDGAQGVRQPAFQYYCDEDECSGATMPEYLKHRGEDAGMDTWEIGHEFHVDAVYSRREKWRVVNDVTFKAERIE